MREQVRNRMGLDIGSTTAKVVILSSDGSIVHSDYRRHNAAINETLGGMVSEARSVLGEMEVSVAVTGSAGLGISERHLIPFVQEVIASAETVRRLYPDVRTLIDVGGEDSKMIFFDEKMRVDIRMNGNCAGGTGAFIDQMATLLNVGIGDLEGLARSAGCTHKIASRCGVFAKTDVQNLISRKISKEEIAASIFHAVALQTVSTLSRGCDPRPEVVFCGGPFTFLPVLKEHFKAVLGVKDEEVRMVDRPELIPAIGTALYEGVRRLPTTLKDLQALLGASGVDMEYAPNRLDPLFSGIGEMEEWLSRRMKAVGRASSLGEARGRTFLGLDSGSTTTKVVLMDEDGRILHSHYSGNMGDPIEAARAGIAGLRDRARSEGVTIEIGGAISTGYGEELMEAAFGMDAGMVETMAHFRAAREFRSDVSFILDIGGQDMKALYIHDGIINDMELNEACSSGCGSFLETFSRNLGMGISEFSAEACRARNPYDLGTRCTVFMNSKVKQALREGASIGDISAGLAISVVKNCLYKVLKIKDAEVLGDGIVVQGGTFRNPAVHRALELVLGKECVCSDIPELMGAYGAALEARDRYLDGAWERSSFIGIDEVESVSDHGRKYLHCKGCQNNCTITRMEFANGRTFFTGNRCERVFSNKGRGHRVGRNLPDEKMALLFDRKLVPDGEPKARVGIPRVLNMFENFPFWATLLVETGHEVVLSPPSTHDIAELGSRNVMSENICYPAKLVGGHIKTLEEMGVDRIFYPAVVFEEVEHEGSLNTFNCPIVTGYPDVVLSTLDVEARTGIRFDHPTISFRDQGLLRKGCWTYLKGLGVPRPVFDRAFAKALEAQDAYRLEVREGSRRILEEARQRNELVVLLIGRPYHVDHLINHKITEMIAQLGADVITEDSIPPVSDGMAGVQVLTQWQYPNRIYNAAKWAREQENVEVVQLNSFGCGPDALVCDEARAILSSAGKTHTLIRIDEVSSPGSMRLRLRSMMESLKSRGLGKRFDPIPRRTTPPFLMEDRDRTILVPHFSDFFSPILEEVVRSVGYEIETLPAADKASVEAGLKYCNNEICYPAIVVIGDLIKAIQSGRYDPKKVALGITQTGGQCRASSYLSLLQKALVTSGHGDIPIVTLTQSNLVLNYQPGLKIDKMRLLRKFIPGVLYSDSLMLMHNSTAPAEKVKGTTRAITERYIGKARVLVGSHRDSELIDLLSEAVEEYNGVELDGKEHPVIGIVGEIYVKYNPFGNFFVVDHLIDQGIEPFVPPIFDFFGMELVNHRFHVEASTKRMDLLHLLYYPAEWYIRYHMRRYEGVRRMYARYRRSHYVGRVHQNARNVVSLIDQFGEGWLIPAEISAFAEEGIHNVVCLQPFGCISNHIIGKGVENALKRKHPDLNVLYLDMDAGSSEVNIYNRLSFMMRSSREDLERREAGDKACCS